MARQARAGELRTKIMVFDVASTGGQDRDGFRVGGKVNVFGADEVRFCKWVNAYGREVLDAKQLGLVEPATLTMRYTPKLTTTCEIYKGKDTQPYEVISINDVENRHMWLEVRVQRKVAAR